MRTFLATTIAAAFAAAPVAARPNLVQNGGFETGDFTGWSASGDEDFFRVSDQGFPSPPEGRYAARLTGGDGFQEGAFLTQTISTNPGARYNVSFRLAANDFSGGLATNEFEFGWGGTTLYTLTSEGGFPFDRVSFKATATTAKTDLAFVLQARDGFTFLDDVRVSAVPEPASWAMMILGFGAVGLAARRRPARATA